MQRASSYAVRVSLSASTDGAIDQSVDRLRPRMRAYVGTLIDVARQRLPADVSISADQPSDRIRRLPNRSLLRGAWRTLRPDFWWAAPIVARLRGPQRPKYRLTSRQLTYYSAIRATHAYFAESRYHSVVALKRCLRACLIWARRLAVL